MSTSKGASYHHGDLSAALVDAALELLGTTTAEALSLREVARRAGVSAAAPYRHYADKEALLAALATRGFEQLGQRLLAADDGSSTGDALVAQGVAYVGFALDQPAMFQLMFSRFSDKSRYPLLQKAGENAYRLLENRVAAQVPKPRRMTLVAGSWALVHGLALLFLDGDLLTRIDRPPDKATHDIVKAMLSPVMAAASSKKR